MMRIQNSGIISGPDGFEKQNHLSEVIFLMQHTHAVKELFHFIPSLSSLPLNRNILVNGYIIESLEASNSLRPSTGHSGNLWWAAESTVRQTKCSRIRDFGSRILEGTESEMW